MTLKALQPNEIKKALTDKSVRMGYIAEALDCSAAHVSNVINRKTYSKRVAECVSLAIGLPVCEVFGDVEAYFSNSNTRNQASIEHKNQIINALRSGHSI
jgi:hypothetical protein